MEPNEVIRDLGVILAAGLVALPLGRLTRIPYMLLLIVAGAVLGPSAAGLVSIPLNAVAVEILLTVGVSVILFHGGLDISLGVLRRVSVGLGMLVVPGVIITTALCGTVAALLFDVPIATGLLIGAVLAPTDPAILIPLFERMGLRPKLRQAIVAESGLNDPTGAVIALTLLAVVGGGDSLGAGPVVDFLEELGISVALGVVAGVILSFVISHSRWGWWGEVSGIAVLAMVVLTFYALQQAGAHSGYMGPFVAGLIVGNMDRLHLGMHTKDEMEMRTVVQGVSDIMVMFVFVILGANLPWSSMGDYWAPALGVVAVLLFVARPLVVALCLGVDRRGAWTRQEKVFVAWTRETGVVPAALAGIVASSGVKDADIVVVAVAFAILATLALQTSTKEWLARRLGLLDPPQENPGLVPSADTRT